MFQTTVWFFGFSWCCCCCTLLLLLYFHFLFSSIYFLYLQKSCLCTYLGKFCLVSSGFNRRKSCFGMARAWDKMSRMLAFSVLIEVEN